MVIPGKDFLVSCEAILPDDQNIIYTGNDQVAELNRLNVEQQAIIARYQAMKMAIKAFEKGDPGYPVFEKEATHQKELYVTFIKNLGGHPDYARKFLPIVKITQGFSKNLKDEGKKGSKTTADYFRPGNGLGSVVHLRTLDYCHLILGKYPNAIYKR